MSVVALVALKRVLYAGQSYMAGEAFEARDDADAAVLKLIGLAADAPSAASNPFPTIQATPTPIQTSEPALEHDQESAVVVPDVVGETVDEPADVDQSEDSLESGTSTAPKRKRRKATEF